MHNVTIKAGWAWARTGAFSVNVFEQWLDDNNIADGDWIFETLGDGGLKIGFVRAEDTVAFKLKFLDNNKEPELF